MKSCAHLLGLCIVCLAGSADAAVVVNFIDSEQYIDARRYGESDAATRGIQQHLQALGEHYLPANTTLKIDVVDFDFVAGRDITGSQPRDTRVLHTRGDWPSARLRYALESDGKVVFRGEESIADKDFTVRFNRYPPTDPLRYEKQMLDDWFKSRFVERKPAEVPAR